MKILFANKFNFLKGGADKYFLDTAELLRANGHEVIKFCMHHPDNLPDANEAYFVSYVDVKAPGIMNKLKYAARFFYSFEAKRKFAALLKKDKPDLIHIHNIYHQISPSILSVAKKYNIPVVMHLHDYKLISPNYTMFAHGKIDESSLGGKYYRCFLNKGFKDSYLQSLIVTLEMYFHHKILNIYKKNIARYIAPSQFMREKVIAAGFPAEKVVHVPYFVTGIENDIPNYDPGSYLLFFGRLSEEKGIENLISAITQLDSTTRLRIIGRGDNEADLRRLVKQFKLDTRIEFVGARFGEDLKNKIRGALAVVVPSNWYEVFGLVNVEAAALGKLVIAANIGGIPETLIDEKTALLYRHNSVEDLAEKIRYAQSHSDFVSQAGRAGRELVISKFTAHDHLPQLLSLYETVVQA